MSTGSASLSGQPVDGRYTSILPWTSSEYMQAQLSRRCQGGARMARQECWASRVLLHLLTFEPVGES